MRQKKIREMMSLENLSFFEASEKIPKTKNNNFINHPSDFPAFQGTKNLEPQSIPLNSRRTTHVSNQQKSSTYSVTLKGNKRRAQDNGTYDKDLHNENILNPNGRLPSTSSMAYSTPNSPNFNKTNNQTSENVFRESSQSLQDIMNMASKLNNSDREHVLNFIAQICNFKSIGSPTFDTGYLDINSSPPSFYGSK
uniref:Uncharacterized protein LOC114331984 n=1 Tax=Diabrotica virgifera virgifera TaxID=50390 RepID=A0A6P7FX77_DIAVI